MEQDSTTIIEPDEPERLDEDGADLSLDLGDPVIRVTIIGLNAQFNNAASIDCDPTHRTAASSQEERSPEKVLGPDEYSIKDYTDEALFKEKRAKIKDEYKNGKYGKAEYRKRIRRLNRQRYMDLTGKIMSEGEKYLLAKNNEEFDRSNAFKEILNKLPPNPKPSQWQIDMLNRALDRYIEVRKFVQSEFKEIRINPKKKADFVQELGLDPEAKDYLDFKLSDPITI